LKVVKPSTELPEPEGAPPADNTDAPPPPEAQGKPKGQLATPADPYERVRGRVDARLTAAQYENLDALAGALLGATIQAPRRMDTLQPRPAGELEQLRSELAELQTHNERLTVLVGVMQEERAEWFKEMRKLRDEAESRPDGPAVLRREVAALQAQLADAAKELRQREQVELRLRKEAMDLRARTTALLSGRLGALSEAALAAAEGESPAKRRPGAPERAHHEVRVVLAETKRRDAALPESFLPKKKT
jgi:chromosome segregation ATPase